MKTTLKRLGWLLGQAPPAEAAARIRLKVLARLSRKWRPQPSGDLHLRPVFHALENAQALRAAFDSSGLARGCADEADKVMRGDFTLFGAYVHHADDTPDWLAAFPAGHRWDESFSFDVDFSGSDARDVRFTWELSRHGDLVALARAAFLTGRTDYRDRLRQLLSSWIGGNPFLRGPNWISPLEVALRSIAWAFIDDAAPVESDDFARTLFSHGAYLDRFLSVGLNPSNHIIGEAAGLFVLGAKFASLAEGRRWHARARAILEREIRRQTFPSGASREQAVGYHRFVTGLLALCLAVAPGGTFSSRFRDRLKEMFAFLAHLARPDGTFPRLGDSDEAVGLRLQRPAPHDLRGDLALAEALFPEEIGFTGHPATTPSPESLWLLGPGAVPKASPATTPAPESVIFADAGLCVLKSADGSLQVEFDSGPQGFTPVASHGHADALSVTLWKNGPRLIDPGACRYNGAAFLRDAFRSTAFHNTITVDKRSQAEPAGPFRWLGLADARPDGSLLSADFDCVAGILESAPSRPWRHRREVIRFGGDLVIILDDLSSPARHSAEAHFHLGDAEVVVDGPLASARYGDGTAMSLFAASPGTHLSVVEPSEEPLRAWRSPSYGTREPSAVLEVSTCFESRAILPWALSFSPAAFKTLEPSVGEAVAFEMTSDEGKVVFAAMEKTDVVHIGRLHFVGRWGLFEFKRGALTRAWAADAWALEYDGNRLFTNFAGGKTGLIHPA